MPKVNKLISSHKCQRCRHDRQKCTPETRKWPGSKCNRCQKYNYDCSANRTRAEEKESGNDAGSSTSVQTLASPEVSQIDVAYCLQELWDLCHIRAIPDIVEDLENLIEQRISDTKWRIQESIEQLVKNGSYKDAESIFSQLVNGGSKSHLLEASFLDDKILSDMIIAFKKVGNHAMVEKCQEQNLLDLAEVESIDEFAQDVEDLTHSYTKFYRRVKGIGLADCSQLEELGRTGVFYRVGLLDIHKMNHRILQNDEVGLPRFPLHVAIKAGAVGLIEALLQKFAYLINDQDHRGRTALHEAAMKGRTSVLRIILGASPALETQEKLGRTALHVAAIYQNEGIVRSLLDAGAEPDSRCNEGKSALHYAASRSRENVVSLLLARGSNIGTVCVQRKTALHYAVSSNREKSVSLLIGARASLEAKDFEGKTPLHLLAECYKNSVIFDKDIMQLLLDAGALIDATDVRGTTILMMVSRCHDAQTAEYLLNAGADLELTDEDGMTPLLYAAAAGSAFLVNLLVSRGANLGARDTVGRTALHITVLFACQREWNAILLALISNDIDQEATDHAGQTGLMIAIKNNKLSQARLLLDHGAKIQAVNSKSGDTLLHLAVQASVESLALLLERGMSTEVKDRWGMTPLLIAAMHGKDEIVEFLLEKGANIDARDSMRQTPLHIALDYSRSNTAQLLLEHNGDIEAKDSYGWTPLHKATQIGDESAIRLLLEHGANFEARDLMGRTPLDVAKPVFGGAAISNVYAEYVEVKGSEEQTPLATFYSRLLKQ